MSFTGNRRSSTGKETTFLLDPKWWLLSLPFPVVLASGLKALFKGSEIQGIGCGVQRVVSTGAGLVLEGQVQLETISVFKGVSKRQWHEVDRDSNATYYTTGSGCGFSGVY